MSNEVNKNVIDVAQTYQTYLVFGGDIDRTAVALNMDRITVANLAQAENWAAKIADINKLREEGPDFQIALNRGINFVQAHRLRSILDKVISHLSTQTSEEIVTLCTKVGKEGGAEFSARPLTDLVKAAETCQVMTQRALGDTVAERPEGSAEKKGGSKVALNVMAAMNAADSCGLDSVSLARKELTAPPRALPASGD